ncbi:MAG TPA: hypothetical protein VFD70_02370 [Anaerolineae bacterium]|nr:hypothetical protein [Anaerolineae bacterium]
MEQGKQLVQHGLYPSLSASVGAGLTLGQGEFGIARVQHNRKLACKIHMPTTRTTTERTTLFVPVPCSQASRFQFTSGKGVATALALAKTVGPS